MAMITNIVTTELTIDQVFLVRLRAAYFSALVICLEWHNGQTEA